MSFNLNQFARIVSTIEDILSMLDDVQISISTNFEGDEIKDEPANHTLNSNLKLSFKLKNGLAKLSIYNDKGMIVYYNNAGELLKEVAFGSIDIFVMNSEFTMAMKAIIATDKQNKQIQSTPPMSSGDSEMDKLRAQLSGIN